MWPEDRRVKVWYIDEEAMVRVMCEALTDRTFKYVITIPELKALMPDLRVYRINYEWDRRSFGVLIGHPSFDPVPDMMPAPMWTPGYEARSVEDAPLVIEVK